MNNWLSTRRLSQQYKGSMQVIRVQSHADAVAVQQGIRGEILPQTLSFGTGRLIRFHFPTELDSTCDGGYLKSKYFLCVFDCWHTSNTEGLESELFQLVLLQEKRSHSAPS